MKAKQTVLLISIVEGQLYPCQCGAVGAVKVKRAKDKEFITLCVRCYDTRAVAATKGG